MESLFTHSTRGAYIVCANAQFDLAAIRDLLLRDSLEIRMVYNSQKLIRATITDQARHRWHVIDVFNILTGRNLAGIGELLGIPKLEKPSFLGEREPTVQEMPVFQQYAIQDAKIAYHAARWIIKELGKLKATLPALTMSLYRKQNPASVWWFRNDPANLELMKHAYHGGRCETFIRGTVFDKVFAYDVRSLYPAVMAEGVYPDLTIQPEEKRDIDLDKEGIAEVTITQEGSVPPLCVKRDVKPRVQRLIFPEGSITDFFTYPELRYLEAHGFGRIGRVKRAWEVRRGPNPFHDFILDLFKRRNDLLLTKDPRQTIYKLLMNSLYGKFAESGTRKEYTFKEGKLTLTDQKQGFTNNTNFLLAAYITAHG